MGDLLAVTVAWLAADGAPNGLVVLAMLTRPSVWSERVTRVVQNLLPRSL